jgi:hypothetical protein
MGMCRAVTCKRCGRPTWAGCGRHVEQVLGHVPPSKRCQCDAKGGSASSAGAARPGLLARLRGAKSR